MNRQIVARLGQLLLIAVFCWCVPFSGAQEKEQEPAKKPAEQVQRPVSAYRLDFSLNEMQAGKKINTRQYSMQLSTDTDGRFGGGGGKQIKIGTQVPYEKWHEAAEGETNKGHVEMSYIDVGTRIRALIKENGNGLELSVDCDITSLADPEQTKSSSRPMLRQMNIEGSTVTEVGKPVVIGSVDDPDSKRQFQLEVTATKLK